MYLIVSIKFKQPKNCSKEDLKEELSKAASRVAKQILAEELDFSRVRKNKPKGTKAVKEITYYIKP
jgi:hypothetical protein